MKNVETVQFGKKIGQFVSANETFYLFIYLCAIEYLFIYLFAIEIKTKFTT